MKVSFGREFQQMFSDIAASIDCKTLGKSYYHALQKEFDDDKFNILPESIQKSRELFTQTPKINVKSYEVKDKQDYALLNRSVPLHKSSELAGQVKHQGRASLQKQKNKIRISKKKENHFITFDKIEQLKQKNEEEVLKSNSLQKKPIMNHTFINVKNARYKILPPMSKDISDEVHDLADAEYAIAKFQFPSWRKQQYTSFKNKKLLSKISKFKEKMEMFHTSSKEKEKQKESYNLELQKITIKNSDYASEENDFVPKYDSKNIYDRINQQNQSHLMHSMNSSALSHLHERISPFTDDKIKMARKGKLGEKLKSERLEGWKLESSQQNPELFEIELK